MDKISFKHLTLRKSKPDRQPTLFMNPPQWNLLKVNECPFCAARLYWNVNRTIIRCKSKLHKFVLTKKSFDEIVSGKRLEAYKEQRKMDLR